MRTQSTPITSGKQLFELAILFSLELAVINKGVTGRAAEGQFGEFGARALTAAFSGADGGAGVGVV